MTAEYVLIRAARYLGVAPWDLMKQSVFWQQKALLYEAVDDHVHRELRRREAAAAEVNSK